MKRWLVVVLALVSPHLARARCHVQIGEVVGYQRCSAFGWWSRNYPTFAYDLGLAGLRFAPGHIDTQAFSRSGADVTTYHVTSAPGDTREISAFGLRIRAASLLPHDLYVASGMFLAPVMTGPRLVADVSARGMTTTMAAASTGFATQNTLALGIVNQLGPLEAAVEVAPGVRTTSFSSTSLPQTVRPPTDFRFLLIADVRVAAWVRPWLSLGLEGAINALNRDDVMVGMQLGLHLTPFDGIR